MYKGCQLNSKQVTKLRKRDGWIQFAENNRGAVYWNELTGEILWLGDEESNAGLLMETVKELKIKDYV